MYTYAGENLKFEILYCRKSVFRTCFCIENYRSSKSSANINASVGPVFYLKTIGCHFLSALYCINVAHSGTAGNEKEYRSKFYMSLLILRAVLHHLCHLVMLAGCKCVSPLLRYVFFIILHYYVRWELKTTQLILIYLPCPGMVMFPRC